MEYRVEINPAKEKEFLQLLKAWQSLGVVMHYEILELDADDDIPAGHDTRRSKRSPAETAWEMAEPYKDLLD